MRARFVVRGAACAALALGYASLALACGSSKTAELLVGEPFGGGADGASSSFADGGPAGATYDSAAVVPKRVYSAEGISMVIAPSTGELEAWGHYAYGVPYRLVLDDGAPSNPHPRPPRRSPAPPTGPT